MRFFSFFDDDDDDYYDMDIRWSKERTIFWSECDSSLLFTDGFSAAKLRNFQFSRQIIFMQWCLE